MSEFATATTTANRRETLIARRAKVEEAMGRLAAMG